MKYISFFASDGQFGYMNSLIGNNLQFIIIGNLKRKKTKEESFLYKQITESFLVKYHYGKIKIEDKGNIYVVFVNGNRKEIPNTHKMSDFDVFLSPAKYILNNI